jgi:hypothetical protein
MNLTDVPRHVIQRGNNRQATFFAEDDYRFCLDCLVDAARKPRKLFTAKDAKDAKENKVQALSSRSPIW